MQNKSGEISLGSVILICVVLFIALAIGYIIPKLPPLAPLVLIVGIVTFFITLVNTDFGLIILIFSMLLSPELKIAEVPQRAVVIRVDDILLGIVFFTWLAKMAVNKQLGLLKSTPLNRPIAAYLLISILSTLRGAAVGDVKLIKSSFYLLKYIEYFMLYFMFANSIRNKNQTKIFIFILLLTCVIVSINAYPQIAKGVPRVTAPFEGAHGEPNTFGGYLLLMMAVSFGLLLYASSSQNIFLLSALICLMIPPFLYTLSRGSFLAFIPMYLTLIALAKKKRQFLIGLLLIAVILLPLIAPNAVKERIAFTFAVGRQYEILGRKITLEPSAYTRVDAWKHISFNYLPKHPLIGHGVTGVGLVDSQYFRVLGELGIIGFLVFLWLISAVFKSALRIFKNEKDNYSKGLALGFLAGFVGLLIQAIFANTFIIVRIMEPFWFLAAVVIMLPQIKQEAVS